MSHIKDNPPCPACDKPMHMDMRGKVLSAQFTDGPEEYYSNTILAVAECPITKKPLEVKINTTGTGKTKPVVTISAKLVDSQEEEE